LVTQYSTACKTLETKSSMTTTAAISQNRMEHFERGEQLYVHTAVSNLHISPDRDWRALHVGTLAVGSESCEMGLYKLAHG